MDVMGYRSSILPMLSFFNVQLYPPIIRNIAWDIIKVAYLYPKSNLCEYTSVSGGHLRVLISLLCTSSHASFKKCCCDLVAGLPKKLIAVKQTRSGQNIENVESAEEKAKFKAAEREMRRWMILALIRSDDDAKQVVRDIAPNFAIFYCYVIVCIVLVTVLAGR